MSRATDARQEALVVGLVSGSHLVNHAYLVLLPPILGVLEADFGVSVAALGLAIGVQGVVNATLQFPFGTLADTRSRTLVLAISLGFGTLGTVVTALAPTYGWLLVGQAVLGVGIAGHHPAHYPLIADATAPGRRGRAYSVHGFAGSLGFAVPPAAVTAVGALGGDWRLALLAIAAVGGAYGLVAVGLLATVVDRSVRVPEGGDAAEGDSPSAASLGDAVRATPGRLLALLADLRRALAAPAMVTLTALAFVTSAAGWGVRTYTPRLLTDGYGLVPDRANLVVTAMFVTGACTILLGGVLSDRYRAEPVLLGGYAALLAVGGVLALGVGVLPAAVAVAVVLPLSGTISVSRPARSSLTDVVSARGDLGKHFALVTIGITAGGAIAPPAFGWLLEFQGVSAVFLCVAALGVVAGLFTLRLILSDKTS